MDDWLTDADGIVSQFPALHPNPVVSRFNLVCCVTRITYGVHDEMRHVGQRQGIGGWADVDVNALLLKNARMEMLSILLRNLRQNLTETHKPIKTRLSRLRKSNKHYKPNTSTQNEPPHKRRKRSKLTY